MALAPKRLTGERHDSEQATSGRTRDELCSPRKVACLVVLLLLDDLPGHGYDLLARLEDLGLGSFGPSRVYRALKWLDDAGLLEQDWQIGPAGPARRVFGVGPRGRRAVRECTPHLRAAAGSLDEPTARFVLERLRDIDEGGAGPEPPPPLS